MSRSYKKNEKSFEVKFGAPKTEKPSPYVLNLNNFLAGKKKPVSEPILAAVAKISPNKLKTETKKVSAPKKIGVPLGRKAGRFFVFLARLPREFFCGIGNAVAALPRFFRFLKFTFTDSKKLVGFGALAFLFVLPLQTFSYYETLKQTEGSAEQVAEEAYSNLTAGAAKISEADFAGAAASFGEAADAFNRSAKEIGNINHVVTSLIKALPVGGEKLEAGEALLFAGEKLSSAGQNILQGLADFSAADNNKKLTDKIKFLRDDLAAVLPDVAAASDRIYSVKSSAVPADKREIFQNVQGALPQVVASIKDFISVADLMTKFLGDEMNKRYLVVFQNPGELRPTGGFMGSLALVDLDRGEVQKMEIPGGGSYDFQGSLRERLAAPEPLQLVNARWELQDANWFPDFPSSAQKIKEFYEKSGGPTIDGVIALNVNVVADLLAVTGPISMPEYGKILDKDNFVDEVQKAVETEYDKTENQPKKIISDMAPKFIDKLLSANPQQMEQVLAVLLKALSEKDLQLYSIAPEEEHEIERLGWGGEIKSVPDSSDYLAVVDSNIGGGKTDRVMEEIISLKTNIAADGSVKNQLTIKRTHKGVKGEPFTGVRNVDYMRVYVPAGSTLVSATGFEAPPANLFEQPESDYKLDPDLQRNETGAKIDAASGTMITNESGKTVFGNWVQVNPGEETVVTFLYTLPFKISFPAAQKDFWDTITEKFFGAKEFETSYRILVQRESGSNAFFQNDLSFPNGWQPVWQYGQNVKVSTASIGAGVPLNTDEFYSFTFKDKN